VDIDDSWEEVEIIMDYFAERQDRIADHAGPGHWNDPDMVCRIITFIKQISCGCKSVINLLQPIL
jgi:hypothetical protein